MLLLWGLGVAGATAFIGVVLLGLRRSAIGRECIELAAAFALFTLIAEWIDSTIGFQRILGLLLALAVAAILGLVLALGRRLRR